MIDNSTSRLGLPLPNPNNYLEDDALRIAEALTILDEKVATVGEDGKVLIGQMPAVAITDTFPVESEAAMLSLDAQPGDVAIRSDVSKSFILMVAPASDAGNWKELINDALEQLGKTTGATNVRAASGSTVQEELDASRSNERLLLRLHYGKAATDIGCTLSAGSFELGATITEGTQLLLDESTRRMYGLSVAVPVGGYVVAPGTDPTQSADWIDVSDKSLREEIGGSSFRNKIVDGRFDFWYEGTSQTTSGYGSDTMWINLHSGSTKTHSRLAMSIGGSLPNIENPSALYASRTVVSSVTGAGNFVRKAQKVEGARTLAGKKATLSFYAKANAAKDLGVHIEQSFGTGGSPSATNVVLSTKLSITDQWVRYSLTFDIPSIAGKVFGYTGNDGLNVIFGFDQGSSFSTSMGGLGHQSGTFDLACVQLEEGKLATRFEDLPFSLAASIVGRYFETSTPIGSDIGTSSSGNIGFTHPKTTTLLYGAACQFRVVKRATPTVTIRNSVGGTKDYVTVSTGSPIAVSSVGGVASTGFSSITLASAPTAAGADVQFHYVADARL